MPPKGRFIKSAKTGRIGLTYDGGATVEVLPDNAKFIQSKKTGNWGITNDNGATVEVLNDFDGGSVDSAYIFGVPESKKKEDTQPSPTTTPTSNNGSQDATTPAVNGSQLPLQSPSVNEVAPVVEAAANPLKLPSGVNEAGAKTIERYNALLDKQTMQSDYDNYNKKNELPLKSVLSEAEQGELKEIDPSVKFKFDNNVPSFYKDAVSDIDQNYEKYTKAIEVLPKEYNDEVAKTISDSKAKYEAFTDKVIGRYNPVLNSYEYKEGVSPKEGDIVAGDRNGKGLPDMGGAKFAQLREGKWQPIEPPDPLFGYHELEPASVTGYNALMKPKYIRELEHSLGKDVRMDMNQLVTPEDYKKSVDQQFKNEPLTQEYFLYHKDNDKGGALPFFVKDYPEIATQLNEQIKQTPTQLESGNGRFELLNKAVVNAYELDKSPWTPLGPDQLVDSPKFHAMLEKLKGLDGQIKTETERQTVSGKPNPKLETLATESKEVVDFFSDPKNQRVLDLMQKQDKGLKLLDGLHQFFPKMTKEEQEEFETQHKETGVVDAAIAPFKSLLGGVKGALVNIGQTAANAVIGTGDLISGGDGSANREFNSWVNETKGQDAVSYGVKHYDEDSKAGVAGNMVNEIMSFTGRMAPTLVSGGAGLAPRAGRALIFGVDSYQNSVTEAKKQGVSETDSQLYGLFNGALMAAIGFGLKTPAEMEGFKPSTDVALKMLNPETREVAAKELTTEINKYRVKQGLELLEGSAKGALEMQALGVANAIYHQKLNSQNGTKLPEDMPGISDFIRNTASFAIQGAAMKAIVGKGEGLKRPEVQDALVLRAQSKDLTGTLQFLDELAKTAVAKDPEIQQQILRDTKYIQRRLDSQVALVGMEKGWPAKEVAETKAEYDLITADPAKYYQEEADRYRRFAKTASKEKDSDTEVEAWNARALEADEMAKKAKEQQSQVSLEDIQKIKDRIARTAGYNLPKGLTPEQQLQASKIIDQISAINESVKGADNVFKEAAEVKRKAAESQLHKIVSNPELAKELTDKTVKPVEEEMATAVSGEEIKTEKAPAKTEETTNLQIVQNGDKFVVVDGIGRGKKSYETFDTKEDAENFIKQQSTVENGTTATTISEPIQSDAPKSEGQGNKEPIPESVVTDRPMGTDGTIPVDAESVVKKLRAREKLTADEQAFFDKNKAEVFELVGKQELDAADADLAKKKANKSQSKEKKNEEEIGLETALDKYNTEVEYKISDLVNEVEGIAERESNEHLKEAVKKYRAEEDYDRQVSGRNDMEAAESDFVAAIKETKTNEQITKESENIKPTEETGTSNKEADTNIGSAEKSTPKKESVLNKKPEEVSIDDILNEINGVRGDADISNGVLKSDKPEAIEAYTQKAKGVLESLYPKAKLTAFETTKEYVKGGGELGTRGFAKMGKNGEHEILLNLEQIREDNSGKTAFHEVIHPIVYDAFTADPNKLTPIWNEVAASMKDVAGMDKVFEHTAFYNSDKQAAEGITETLTQIAQGNISLKDVPKSAANKIIELINKMFEAVGIEYRIKDVNDFATVANKIKEAFDTSKGEGLKDVIKGKNIDKFIADYEKLSAKDIDPEHLKKLHDLLRAKVEGEVKEGKLTPEDAAKILDKAGIKEPPPKEPAKPTDNEESGRLNNKGILNRLNEAKGTPEAARKGFAEKGLKYEPSSQKEAEGIAKTVIDEIGMDEALLLAGAGKFKGDTNSLIYAESLNRLAKAESAAKTPEEKLQQAQRYAEVAMEYDEVAREKGRFISAINYFYKKSALGIKLVEKARRDEAFKEWFKNKDKPAREFFEEMMKEPEFSDLIKERVESDLKKERATARAGKRQKISDLFDSAKLDKGAMYATFIPPSAINGAIEIMKQATLAGESIVHVVSQAIDHISKELGGKDWDKEKFRKEWEEKLSGVDAGVTEKTKSELSKDKQEKMIERFRKKLKGLSEKEKDEVIRRSFKKLVENGALKYDDFKKIIGDVLGYGEMTEAESAKLEQLVNDINVVDEIGRKARDEEHTIEALIEYRAAKKKAEKSATELGQLVYSKVDLIKRLTGLMQLNTLGVPSLVNNVAFNIINQSVVRFPSAVQLTVLDQILFGASKVSNKIFGTNLILPENNFVVGQKEFWRKGLAGAKESYDQIWSGLTNRDYFQKEVHTSQIHPFTSAKELWQFAKGEKHLSGKQVIDKGLQATAGVPAEIVARTLNAGDKPQRYAAEGSQGAVFAKNLGFKGVDYEYFMEFPKEEAFRKFKADGLSDELATKKAEQIQERIIKQGEYSVFQEDNLLNDMINAVFEQTKKYGDKAYGFGQIAKTLNMPFVKIPVNAAWAVYNLINPQVAFVQSMMYAAKAIKTKSPLDIQQSKRWAAHGVTGLAITAVTGALLGKGIVNASNEKDETKKERQGERTYEQQEAINVTKLAAFIAGKDPDKVNGGLMVDLKWFGALGQVMNFQARKFNDMTPEQKENNMELMESMYYNMTKSGLDILQNGVFSGVGSFVTAIDKGSSFMDSYLLNLINMGTNIVQPAMFAQMSRAQLPYYTKQKADTFYEEVKSSMLARSSTLRYIASQMPKSAVDAWGDKMDRPDNVVMKLFGISSSNKDNFAQPIYEDYKKTGNTKFLPPAVMPILNHQKLTVSESEKLETLVGQARKNLVGPFINDMAQLDGFDNVYSGLTPEQKIEALNILYEEGFNNGKDQFVSLFPKYAEPEKTEEQKEETENKTKFRKQVKSQAVAF